MNKIYRLVWNAALHLWQVSAEFTRAHRKSGRTGAVRSKRTMLLWLVPMTALGSELPTNGVISAGSGVIDQAGAKMTIAQHSERMVLDWQSFSIGEGATVQFVQPSARSAALNRVLGTEVSKILGSLEANGQVFLVNPNGVLFGASSAVNVGGLVASTLDIAPEDFLADNLRFAGDSDGAVINHGKLAAHAGGYVALIGARIENAGEILAPNGAVALAAGRKVRLDLGGPVKLEIDEAALEALIEQRGAIRADGGHVLLTASAAAQLASTVINHSGIIEARSLGIDDSGEIVLAGSGGAVEVNGTLDVASVTAEGGKVTVTGDTVRLHEDARIDASGNSAGGAIYVGGGWQGKDSSIANAASTAVAAGALLDASATNAGNGGTVVVWADGQTRYAGSIVARGAQGGVGGRVEVSGKQSLAFDGAVDTGGGTLLLDPASLTIQDADGNLDDTIGVAQLRTLLASNNVELSADDAITWDSDAALDYDGLGSSRRLTLSTTDGDIAFNGWIYDSNPGDDALSVTLDARGTGTLYFDEFARIEAGAGGSIVFKASGHAQIDGHAQTWGYGGIEVYSASGDVELNKGVLRTQDGSILVDSYDNIVSIWNSRYVVDGTGSIVLTSQSGGIYIGGSIALSESYIQGGSGDIVLTGNAIVFQNVNTGLTGTGRLILQPNHRDTNVVIGNTSAPGALSLKAADFTNRISNTFAHILIGRGDGASTMTIGTVNFRTPITLLAGGDIDVTGQLRTGGHDLTVNAGGAFGTSASGIVQTFGGDFYATIGGFDIAGGQRFRAAVDTGAGDIFIHAPSAHLAFSGARLTTTSGGIAIEAGTGGATGAQIELGDGTEITTENGNIQLAQLDTNGQTLIGAGALGSTIRAETGTVTLQDAARIRIEGASGIYADLGDIRLEAPEMSFGTTTAGTTIDAAGRVTLVSAGGFVAQASGNMVQANELLLTGTSDFALEGNNQIQTLAADIDGSLTFRHADGLTVGAVGVTSGIRATGAIDISTQSDDLVVAAPIVTTDASANAITLNAGRGQAAGTSNGGNVVLDVPNALSAGGGGRITLYTGSIADSTSLAPFAQDGHARYGSDETTTNYTAALGAGTYVIYREQPTLRYVAGDASGSYGDAPDLSGVTHTIVSGYLGDDASFDTITSPGTFSTAANATSNVGNYALTYAGAVLSSLGYATAASGSGNGTYTVTPRVLDLSGSRAYDGTTNVDPAALVLGNLANGDTLTLTGAGLLANANAAASKVLSIGSLALGDGTGLASNYTLVGGTHRFDVTPRQLTLGGSFLANARVYDGSTAATLSDVSSLNLIGLVPGETLRLTGLAAAFDDPNAGLAKSVSLTAASLADGLTGSASNYTLSLAGAPTATTSIIPRTVTLAGTYSVAGKVYDGTTAATVLDIGGLSLSGLVAGEDLSLAGVTAAFADANAGQGKTVVLTLANLADGANGIASNYVLDLTDVPLSFADITPKGLTVRVENRTALYDGAVYDDGFATSFDGFIAGEDASVLSGSLSFTGAGRNVGTYTISAAGLSSTNYAIDYVDGLLTIDPADLTISVRDIVKTYDATTRANGVAIAVDGTQLFGDDTLSGGTFAFLDPHAGGNKTVTVSNVTIDDGNGGANYRITYRDNTASTIERAPLVVSVDDVAMRYTGAPYVGGFSVSYAGFVGDEDANVLEGELRFDGPALDAVRPGRYAIAASGLSAANYAISYEPGSLHIQGKEDNAKVAGAQYVSQTIAQHAAGGAANGSLLAFGKNWNVDDSTAATSADSDDRPGADQARAADEMRLVVIDGGIRLPF